MAEWEKRIEELGIELMDPLPAGGLYAPVVIVGELAFTSGTVAVEGPPLKLAYPGCLGDDIDVETGKLSAARALISTLSNLRGALGTLDRIDRFVKMTGYVRSTPDFKQMPQVMDGASQLMIDIFGQPCARSAIGVTALPGGASVELDTVLKAVVMTDAASAYVKTQHHLTLEAAEAVLAAAVAQAETVGPAAVIVVTDAAGGVTSLARLDGAPPIAIRHALAKASSASGLKRSTDEFVAKRLTQDDVLWRAISGRGDAFVVQGGFPLTVEGRVVGAIGVATGAHEHDSEIAQAGVAALEALAADVTPA